MELMASKQNETLCSVESNTNRRQSSRVAGAYGLTFSGVDGGRFMMGDGEVIDLSDEGLGILTDRSVRAGMELALFIELPDSEDHLCIPEARVSWVQGHRFGVALRTLKLEDQRRLRFFILDRQHHAHHRGEQTPVL